MLPLIPFLRSEGANATPIIVNGLAEETTWQAGSVAHRKVLAVSLPCSQKAQSNVFMTGLIAVIPL